jgi:hypothetical protein
MFFFISLFVPIACISSRGFLFRAGPLSVVVSLFLRTASATLFFGATFATLFLALLLFDAFFMFFL